MSLSPSSPLPFRGFERRAGAFGVALGALISVIAVTAFVPAVAWAQPAARVTLYEVLQALRFKDPIRHSDPQAFSRRFAEVTLLGNKVVPSLRDLDRNGDPNLLDLVVVASGRLQGTLDLRPVLILDPNTGQVSHFAPVSGTWDLKNDGRKPGGVQRKVPDPVRRLCAGARR